MEFCNQCGNIMVLKSKSRGLGTYVCRNCSSVRALPVDKMEITERIEMSSAEPLVFIQRKSQF